MHTLFSRVWKAAAADVQAAFSFTHAQFYSLNSKHDPPLPLTALMWHNNARRHVCAIVKTRRGEIVMKLGCLHLQRVFTDKDLSRKGDRGGCAA